MNTIELITTAQAMMAEGKGLLAMDESTGTCNRRFASLGIPQTEEMRRQYRQLILTTPNLGDYISGYILYDETVRQKSDDGTPLLDLAKRAGVIPGIKVDTGAKDLALHPGEKVTEGLDGLRERLAEYSQMGLKFSKWRAVITIDEGIPTRACIEANVHALARYAALCQEAGLVPIVEPEVLMDGDHSIEECCAVTEATLHTLYDELYLQGVMLEGSILKPNMILSGLDCTEQASVEEVAETTIDAFRREVPAAVAGVAFLSGGQPAELASARLNEMNRRYAGKLPWAVSFSFSRAIQQPALDLWRGNAKNTAAAQQALYHRARCNGAARRGEYTADMEKETGVPA